MRVLFCGVRGSTCAPGADFLRYGGHTSCVALAHDGAAPSLVLDAGTGLRNLTRHLDGEPFRGTILLGHLHWDHTHGLPFFAAGDHPGSDVTVVMPAQGDPGEVLERAFSPPHFPVTPSQLRGRWRITSHEPGDSQVEGFSVTSAEIPHKGGRTFGYRVTDGRATIAYLSDHSPIAEGEGPEGLGAYHESALALAQDADVLIHDAQHTADEFRDRRFLGHAAIEYAIGLAETAGAGMLVLFHHDPGRTDDFTRAQAHAEEWLANEQHFGSPERVADALAFLGTLSERTGQVRQARRLFQESLGSYAKGGHRSGVDDVLRQLVELD